MHNAPNFISAIRQITSGPAGPAAVGQRYGASAIFLGKPTNLTLRVVGLDPGRRVVIALEGDPAGTLTINLTPERGGQATRVELILDVPSVAGILLGALMGGMLDESLTHLGQAVR